MDFVDRCREELRRWAASGQRTQIDPDLIEEIDTKTLIELADFTRNIFPQITDELIIQNARDIRWAKESAEFCKVCRWMPGNCARNGEQMVLEMQPDGWINLNTVRCSRSQIMGKVV